MYSEYHIIYTLSSNLVSTLHFILYVVCCGLQMLNFALHACLHAGTECYVFELLVQKKTIAAELMTLARTSSRIRVFEVQQMRFLHVQESPAVLTAQFLAS